MNAQHPVFGGLSTQAEYLLFLLQLAHLRNVK